MSKYIRTPGGIVRYDNNFTDEQLNKLLNCVDGIKGEAETGDYRHGNVIITKKNIGLELAENTPDKDKKVLSATKLATARDITIGKQTISFDGTKDIAFDLISMGALPLAGGTMTGTIKFSGSSGFTAIDITGVIGSGTTGIKMSGLSTGININTTNKSHGIYITVAGQSYGISINSSSDGYCISVNNTTASNGIILNTSGDISKDSNFVVNGGAVFNYAVCKAGDTMTGPLKIDGSNYKNSETSDKYLLDIYGLSGGTSNRVNGIHVSGGSYGVGMVIDPGYRSTAMEINVGIDTYRGLVINGNHQAASNLLVVGTSGVCANNTVMNVYGRAAFNNQLYANNINTTSLVSTSSITAANFLIVGTNHTVSRTCSAVIGQGLNIDSGSNTALAIGKYNSNQTNNVFEIGYGVDADTRSNILWTDTSGKTYFNSSYSYFSNYGIFTGSSSVVGVNISSSGTGYISITPSSITYKKSSATDKSPYYVIDSSGFNIYNSSFSIKFATWGSSDTSLIISSSGIDLKTNSGLIASGNTYAVSGGVVYNHINNNYLPLAGGTMTGNIQMGTNELLFNNSNTQGIKRGTKKINEQSLTGLIIGDLRESGNGSYNILGQDTYVNGFLEASGVITAKSYIDIATSGSVVSGNGRAVTGGVVYNYVNTAISSLSYSNNTLSFTRLNGGTGSFTINLINTTDASSVTHTNYGTNGKYVPTMNFLSYWNGAYSSSGGSNLAYCKHGAFGNIVTYNTSSFAAASHSHSEYAAASHSHSEYAAASHSHSYIPLNPTSIELYFSTPFIDFHFNNSAADHTSRIIESRSGNININGVDLNNDLDARVGCAYIYSNDGTGDVTCSSDFTVEGKFFLSGLTSSSSITNGLVRNSEYKVFIQSLSSKRFKHDIVPISGDLDPTKLYDLRVVQFKYNDGYLDHEDIRYMKDIPGFIAEEVNEIYPIACDLDKNENGEYVPFTWNHRIMVPSMLKLIQDQKKEIDLLKDELLKLNNSIDKLKQSASSN